MLRVERGGDGVRLRDVRAVGLAPLFFSYAEWASFVEGLRRGDFDFVTESLCEATAAPLDDDEP